MKTHPQQPVPATGQLVETCLQRFDKALASGAGQRCSPLAAVGEVLRSFQGVSARHGPRVINDHPADLQSQVPISAWPLWFAEAQEAERPLFYLTRSPTSAHLSMLSRQIGERGIVFNDIESSPSRWAKGAHPWLPLWLAGNRQCLPFDPACGAEALAIVVGALRSLYVEGRPGFCYLTLHDQIPSVAGPYVDLHGAWLGLYRVNPPAPSAPLRLLGAGRMLDEVREAARLLAEDWGVACELWSCPSYTRLARDAERAGQRSHLLGCLGQGDRPVLAVTGYAQFVAAQIGAHLPGPFRALGADSLAPGQRLDRHWVAYSALQMLVDSGHLPVSCLAEALQCYRLN
ncbi:pyruvate dehydrogenase [Pseudomonas sp. DTU_2021_1001937_2_SI_NGA_ILE_001]|uniref:transketolase-like TK C-terminal-containing protein n=1 Tax=Pseudomonas sp. DTU_2021_1001937_2_SI_NGA_ILE_001 TaxID=3077589 RepID=UPI0028FC2274|nr:pyruvate dehydrogenase [Pseudomonas sp. DTU_2021_1001937_2_SI_NGA_ILE_001]WNW10983.1 pyruvate dehydrogenase [Pseudomonas sp. DTU_2021_1001937_2_SI_NGA_ILE_001]